MKSSREQFEEWIYKNRMRGVPFDIEVFDVDGAIFYKSTETQGQWNAWQASRAAIEIELPDKLMVEDEFDNGHNCAIDYCADSIRSAGITVKGDA
ncbi:hypothetical protein [Escherichia phage BUCT618]|nr:hypothetical protein [Escherichia phage BUCT618]